MIFVGVVVGVIVIAACVIGIVKCIDRLHGSEDW